jgi:hypothetical protein
VADRSTTAEKTARELLDDARKAADQAARAYGEAFANAIVREQDRAAAESAPRQAVYLSGGVLLRMTDNEASLRRRLQEATVTVNAAEAEYVRICKIAMVRRYK